MPDSCCDGFIGGSKRMRDKKTAPWLEHLIARQSMRLEQIGLHLSMLAETSFDARRARHEYARTCAKLRRLEKLHHRLSLDPALHGYRH
jgi:hypothetical protein